MKQTQRPLVVHSIDVGLGYVKHTKHLPDSTIGFDSFPAIAIASDASFLKQVGTRTRNTIDVPVVGEDGVTSNYEVGKDVQQAVISEFGRDVSASYYTSPIYEALMLGALRFTGAEVIDVLVLGLPVSQYLVHERRASLIEKWTRPEGVDTGNGRTVVIKDVIVRPQPLGGYAESLKHLDLIDQAIQASPAATYMKKVTEARQVIDMCVLVVDPGEFTLDWLVVNKGSIVERASGAAEDAGRHRVVQAVTKALEDKVGRQLPPVAHGRINQSLLDGTPVKLSGEYHDLAQFAGAVKTAVNDPVNKMYDGLKSVFEILDLIVVVGGHPKLYAAEVSSRFKSLPLVMLPEGVSVMANVAGFQDIGEAAAAQMAKKAA